MKWENRKRLRDALVGRTIQDVEFHGSHGLIVDLILDNATKLSVCTYDDGKKHNVDEFYVGLNDEEL
jgi:hypothetical protein